MRIVLMILATLICASCANVEKKSKSRHALPPNAEVQVFYNQPNVRFEEICEIKANGPGSKGLRSKEEDFEDLIRSEARKCGANGAIFSYMTSERDGSISVTGIGIRVFEKAAAITTQDAIKEFSLAVQRHDIGKVQKILANVPKRRKNRAASDSEIVDVGLYIATLDGLNCDAKIISILEKEYQGIVPQFKAADISIGTKSDKNTPLCNNVIARSLPKMANRPAAISTVGTHYVAQLKQSIDSESPAKVAKYNSVLKTASTLIAKACAKSSSDPTCTLKEGYLDWANKTKTSKTPEVQKNAKDVLRILAD